MVNVITPINRDVEAFCGGLIGVGIIATIQMLSLQVMSPALWASLYCFIVSIPFLVLIMVLSLVYGTEPVVKEPWYVPAAFMIGVLLSLAGVVAIFFHLSANAALTFMGVSVPVALASAHYSRKVVKQRFGNQ